MNVLREVFDHWSYFAEGFWKPDLYRQLVQDLPDEVVDLVAVECLFNDVLNGGFDQYFSNSGGISVKEAIRGLRDMGLHEYAEIANEALDLMGERFVDDKVERCKRMYDDIGAVADNEFDVLDKRFYEINYEHDLTPKILEKYAISILSRYRDRPQ